ncbi:MAG: ATP-binding protein [Rickettsiales bacterium]|jgi:predicted AAA+ superfamily ATPase|nr:ATP-binding protein [Rickettsiales bacterium]
MERAAYKDLLAWKASKTRRPLVLYGARQVGKTWLLQEFGRKEYRQTLYLNFDANRKLHQYFGDNITPSAIIPGLEDYFGTKITPEDTLLIFDEVQEAQRAKDSLKYFNELAPQYHIAAAGSFLGIAQGKFPVGKVDELTLLPLSFYEFLEATGKNLLLNNIKNLAPPMVRTIGITAEPKLKEYMYVGGMPEAVNAFINTGSLLEARKVQDKILNNYQNDFTKHIRGADIPKVRMIWQSIPYHLAKEKKKFMYRELRVGARAAAYENALDWLVNTGLVYKLNRTGEAKLPLGGYTDGREAFKIYMLDTGLLGAASGLDIKTFYDPDPLVFKEFKGAMAEQFVMQELKTLGNLPVCYWGRDKGKSEVDFIVQWGNEIVPIEVKSGIRTRSQSLDIYRELYKPRHAIKTTLNNFGIAGDLYSIPLYMIADFGNIIAKD